MFRSRGAYLRHKDLSDKKCLFDKWYKFEDERQKQTLKQGCLENNIELEG
jgi:hypothetical protein